MFLRILLSAAKAAALILRLPAHFQSTAGVYFSSRQGQISVIVKKAYQGIFQVALFWISGSYNFISFDKRFVKALRLVCLIIVNDVKDYIHPHLSCLMIISELGQLHFLAAFS